MFVFFPLVISCTYIFIFKIGVVAVQINKTIKCINELTQKMRSLTSVGTQWRTQTSISQMKNVQIKHNSKKTGDTFSVHLCPLLN